jgi:hypothetical protein
MLHEPFEHLRETLLQGGVAPRHVRRYLAELREHLQDLTTQQQAAGHDPQDAVLRARALLGSDGELAAAMLEQKQFRSLAARAPWAVFLLLPPLTAIAIGMVLIGSLVALGAYYDLIGLHAPPPPPWFQALATNVVAIANLAMMPLAATWFTAIAARQRLKLAWPLATTVLLLILFIYSDVSFVPRHQDLNISLAPIFMADAWKRMAEHWQLVTAQYLLTVAPLAWLARHRMAQS